MTYAYPLLTDSMLDPSGFDSPADVIVSYDSSTRKITLTGTVKAYWRGKIVTTLVSGWQSAAHDDTAGKWFLLYDGTNFVWQQSSWGFDKIQIAYINYGATNKFGFRECHGVMPWQVHKTLHESIGTYRVSGGDVGGIVAGSTTAAERRPSVSATTIADEDLTSVVNALVDDGPYTQMYLTGEGSSATFVTNAAEIVPVSGTVAYYNQFTSTWVQTALNGNAYGAVWLVALPVTNDAESQAYRYLWIQGQTTTSTLSTAQAWDPRDLNLDGLKGIAPEMVFLAKIIIRANASGTNWSITSVTNLTGSKMSTIQSPGGNFLTSVSVNSPLGGSGTATDPLTVDLSSKMSNPMTQPGDLIIGGSSGAPSVLHPGADDKVLTLKSGLPSWETASSGPSGITGVYPETFGNGVASTFIITHGFGTKDVDVAIYETTGLCRKVDSGIEIQNTNTNQVTLICDTPPATNSLRAVVSCSGGQVGPTGPAASHGDIVLDFGAYPGSSEVSVVVTGQTGIQANSRAFVQLASTATLDHTLADHMLASTLIGFATGSIIAGTGFTIRAYSKEPLRGTFNAHWAWV